MNVLNCVKYKCSVSSVLNKKVKHHGKHFMLDNKEDTAWSSDQGSPQWIIIEFETPQEVSSFTFQFQGGFVGNDCIVRIEDYIGKCIYEELFYPEDTNAVQNFKLKNRINGAYKIKFVFKSTTDFFGRIVIYKLEIFK